MNKNQTVQQLVRNDKNINSIYFSIHTKLSEWPIIFLNFCTRIRWSNHTPKEEESVFSSILCFLSYFIDRSITDKKWFKYTIAITIKNFDTLYKSIVFLPTNVYLLYDCVIAKVFFIHKYMYKYFYFIKKNIEYMYICRV